MGDKEVEYYLDFCFIFYIKLVNFYYKFEMQVQIILINFIVICEGLEDQLLVDVVCKERFDFEEMKVIEIVEQNIGNLMDFLVWNFF